MQTQPEASQGLRLSLELHRMVSSQAWESVRGEFEFDPDAPLLVSITFFIDEDGPRVTWQVGRDLLDQGLRSTSGIGDVQVWPSYLGEEESAWLQLSSYDVTALFEMPAPPLAEWLERTYQIVPAGAEMSRLDPDAFLAGLLGDPGTAPGRGA
ncbi:SsgA family sporulation/cell division regulator [Streptomyces sp. NPDC093065]|uniref:SsgA family sporulation/cell division regulator n=1 Tax=Streptomyces sp. NPDC093065 TaxID=3366021 RepID=UPI00380D1985